MLMRGCSGGLVKQCKGLFAGRGWEVQKPSGATPKEVSGLVVLACRAWGFFFWTFSLLLDECWPYPGRLQGGGEQWGSSVSDVCEQWGAGSSVLGFIQPAPGSVSGYCYGLGCWWNDLISAEMTSVTFGCLLCKVAVSKHRFLTHLVGWCFPEGLGSPCRHPPECLGGGWRGRRWVLGGLRLCLPLSLSP